MGKIRNIPGDIILLHMCTINEDHMIYDSWDIRHDGQFFVILGPFTLLTTQKIKILKKWKKRLEILFYTCVSQMTIIWFMVSEIWSATDGFFCHFRLFSAPWPPLTTQWEKNEKKLKIFLKNEKKPGDIIILHKCTKNHDHMLHCS